MIIKNQAYRDYEKLLRDIQGEVIASDYKEFYSLKLTKLEDLSIEINKEDDKGKFSGEDFVRLIGFIDEIKRKILYF